LSQVRQDTKRQCFHSNVIWATKEKRLGNTCFNEFTCFNFNAFIERWNVLNIVLYRSTWFVTMFEM